MIEEVEPDNQSKKEKSPAYIIPAILFISFLVCYGIYLADILLIRKIQLYTLKSHDSIYFCGNKSLTVPIIIILVIILLSVLISKKLHLSRFVTLSLFSVVAIISLIIFSNSFFDYVEIKKDCITHTKGFMSFSTRYEFNDISDVWVCHYKELMGSSGRNTGKIDRRLWQNRREYHIYCLNMKNGDEFNIRNSPEFWNKIVVVDNILQNKSVRIKRFPIDLSDIHKYYMWYDFTDSNTVSWVLSQIFKVENS